MSRRCTGDLLFTIPHLPGGSITERLAAALSQRFSLTGPQPSFIQYLAVFFFCRPTLSRQGQAIFTPGTYGAAIRIGGPETVRIAIQTLDGPNKVWHIRYAGTFGLMFSFFEAPIRKSGICSLRFHWTVCGPQQPAATPSFRIDIMVWIFICLIYG
jgi:hypothetical protein